MAKLGEFDVFGDATPPVSHAAGAPGTSPAAQAAEEARGSASPRGGGKAAQGATQGRAEVSEREAARGAEQPEGDGAPAGARGGGAPAEERGRVPARRAARRRAASPAEPHIDPAALDRWRWVANAAAGKVAATERAAESSWAAWVAAVADGVAEGVPRHVFEAAALRVGVDMPE